MKEIYSLNYREAMQTPAEGISENLHNQDSELLPPPNINFKILMQVIAKLNQFENLYVELPNPAASPRMFRKLNEIITMATERQVNSRLALHTRLSFDDIDLAVQAGISRLYVYASTQSRNYKPGLTVNDILEKLDNTVEKLQDTQVNFVRASLEHTTMTPEKQVGEFIKGLAKINRKYSRKIIKGLGIPDTTGIATPDQYKKYLELIAQNMPDPPLTVFAHLHNDQGNSMANLQIIKLTCAKHNLPLCIEVVPEIYPGERVGIRPYMEEEISPVILKEFPEITKVLEGDSWITRRISRQFVQSIHVAGVHTNSMNSYANHNLINYPHPGLYTIMGGNNIRFIQNVLFGQVSSDETLKQAALLGREISARNGNLIHAYAIKIAKIALEKPDKIARVANDLVLLDDFYNKINQ